MPRKPDEDTDYKPPTSPSRQRSRQTATQEDGGEPSTSAHTKERVTRRQRRSIYGSEVPSQQEDDPSTNTSHSPPGAPKRRDAPAQQKEANTTAVGTNTEEGGTSNKSEHPHQKASARVTDSQIVQTPVVVDMPTAFPRPPTAVTHMLTPTPTPSLHQHVQPVTIPAAQATSVSPTQTRTINLPQRPRPRPPRTTIPPLAQRIAQRASTRLPSNPDPAINLLSTPSHRRPRFEVVLPETQEQDIAPRLYRTSREPQLVRLGRNNLEFRGRAEDPMISGGIGEEEEMEVEDVGLGGWVGSGVSGDTVINWDNSDEDDMS